MAQQTKLLMHAQERYDLPDKNAFQELIATDFDLWNKALNSPTFPRIINGFTILHTPPSLDFEVVIPGSILLNCGGDGQMYYGPSTGPLSANLTGTAIAGATTYWWLEVSNVDTNKQMRTFWDPSLMDGAGAEFNQEVYVNRELKVELKFQTGNFPTSGNVVHLMKTVAGGADITTFIDCRNMMFRLSSGADSPDISPNLDYVYPFVDRNDHGFSGPNTAVFTGGDKELKTFKDWMDAVMSQIREIKFGNATGLDAQWYLQAPSTLSDIFVEITGGGVWNWNTTTSNITFSEDANILIPRTAFINRIAAGTINLPAVALPGSQKLAYIDIDRTSSATLIPVITDEAAFVPAVDRFIIAKRYVDTVYIGTDSRLRLDNGESGQLVTPLTTQNLMYQGAPNESTFQPTYSSFLLAGKTVHGRDFDTASGGANEEILGDNDSLSAAIAKIGHLFACRYGDTFQGAFTVGTAVAGHFAAGSFTFQTGSSLTCQDGATVAFQNVGALPSTGVSPFTVASSRKVTNLNADYLDDLHKTAFGASINNSGNNLVLYNSDGTALSTITVAFATNCDTVDGEHASAFIHKTNVGNDVTDPTNAQDVATKNYVDTRTIPTKDVFYSASTWDPDGGTVDEGYVEIYDLGNGSSIPSLTLPAWAASGHLNVRWWDGVLWYGPGIAIANDITRTFALESVTRTATCVNDADWGSSVCFHLSVPPVFTRIAYFMRCAASSAGSDSIPPVIPDNFPANSSPLEWTPMPFSYYEPASGIVADPECGLYVNPPVLRFYETANSHTALDFTAQITWTIYLKVHSHSQDHEMSHRKIFYTMSSINGSFGNGQNYFDFGADDYPVP